jgi:hypothetical protein
MVPSLLMGRNWCASGSRASSEKIQVARIDLAKTYTNEFVVAGNEAGRADRP